MAIYHLSAQVFSRGSGHSAVHAAAYRARDDLTDERTGLKHDYSRKADELLFEGIYAPKDAPEWARDRQQLWNHVEAFEKHRRAELAREFNIALPYELTLEQNRYALQDWIRDNFTRKGLIADAVIHAPSADGDERNMHAHVMVVMRKLDGSEFVRTKERFDTYTEKDEARKAELVGLRESWARIGNRHLERHGFEPTLDHRTLEAQGVDREPTIHKGKEATAVDRSGKLSELGEVNREITADNERKVIDLAAERAMREARAAAQGRTDDIRPEGERSRYADLRATERDVSRSQVEGGRYDNLRAAEPPPEIARQFETGATRAAEPAAPIYDRDAAGQAADQRIIDAAIAAEQAMRDAHGAARGRVDNIRPNGPGAENTRTSGPENGREAQPLSSTAADIRMAWSLSRSGSELQEGLAAHGIGLALTSAEEARASQRAAAFAREVGSFARVLREGEIVAVNGAGHVYRLDERTTGQTQREIEGRLAGVDRAELLNITDTKEALREASHAAWVDQQRAEQEAARPPSLMESRIADCADQARTSGAVIQQDAEGRRVSGVDALRDYFRPEDERQTHVATIHGPEAFAARLEQAGIAIARVTETDLKGLDALRRDESMARVSADTNIESHKARHFAADLVIGDLAAVTRDGDVYRINPDKLGDAKQYLAADLPGVIDTRARLEIEREQTSALWQERRADAATARADFAAERESSHQAAETARDVRQFNQEIGEAVDTGLKSGSRFMGSLARGLEKFIDFLDSLMPAPPPTRDQAERMERAAEENQQARAHQEAQTERAESQYWLVEEARRQAAREREEEERAKTAAELYGTPKPRTQERDNDRDRGYEREM